MRYLSPNTTDREMCIFQYDFSESTDYQKHEGLILAHTAESLRKEGDNFLTL